MMTQPKIRHFHFTSSLFLKLSGIKEGGWFILTLSGYYFPFFYCSHSLLPSKTQLHGPGGGFWSDGVSSLSHISDSLRPGCPQPVTVLSLSLLWPFCSTALSRYAAVDRQGNICLSTPSGSPQVI